MVAAAMRNRKLEKCFRQPHIMAGRLRLKVRMSLISVKGCYAATFVVKSPYVFLSNPDVACEAEVQTKFSESKDCVAHHVGWYSNAHVGWYSNAVSWLDVEKFKLVHLLLFKQAIITIKFAFDMNIKLNTLSQAIIAYECESQGLNLGLCCGFEYCG